MLPFIAGGGGGGAGGGGAGGGDAGCAAAGVGESKEMLSNSASMVA
jgi:hypothetical protein